MISLPLTSFDCSEDAFDEWPQMAEFGRLSPRLWFERADKHMIFLVPKLCLRTLREWFSLIALPEILLYAHFLCLHKDVFEILE